MLCQYLKCTKLDIYVPTQKAFLRSVQVSHPLYSYGESHIMDDFMKPVKLIRYSKVSWFGFVKLFCRNNPFSLTENTSNYSQNYKGI